ncbi:MAG: cytochrome-c peroxidase [Betaproteobacteria bacterium]
MPAHREGRGARAYAPLFCLALAAAVPAFCAAAPGYGIRVPLGLEARALVIPEDNPLTAEKIALGKQLFFDPRWSKTQTVSCSSCHHPQKGWSDDRRFSLDHEGKPTPRHAPTIINRAFSRLEGWIGHRQSTEDLLFNLPFTSAEAIAQNIAPVIGYQVQFQRVYGTPVTPEGVAQAIAAYQRTILSGNAAFDRAQAGDRKALNAAARRGHALFEGKARCSKCHGGPNFTDEGYHNTGIGTDSDNPDLGRFLVTRRNVNRSAFKTPTLRDVARRGPYMHDGSLATLRDVIAFYDRGGLPNPRLSPEMAPLNLSAREREDLLAFLESLTGQVSAETTALPVLPQ